MSDATTTSESTAAKPVSSAEAQFRGVMPKDIEGAFIELLLAGKNPTIENIRLHLGRGSPNTITKHRAAFLERVAESRSIPLPAPIPEGAASLMAQMWGLLSAEAFAKYTSEVEAAQAQTHKAQADAEAAIVQAQQAAAREVETLQAQLQQAEQYALALKEDGARKDLRIGHLTGQIEALQADNAKLHTAAVVAEQAHQQVMMELTQEHATKLMELTTQHQQRVQEEVERRNEISSSYSAMLKREAGVSAGLEAQLKIANSRYDADTARLMQQVDDLTQELKAERKAQKASAEKFSAIEKELKAQIEQQRHESSHLAQANSALIEEKSAWQVSAKNQLSGVILLLSKLATSDKQAQLMADYLGNIERTNGTLLDALKQDPLLHEHWQQVQKFVLQQ